LAIDTEAKRKSCIGVTLFFLRMGVVPAATDLSAGDRLHTNGLYSGIAAAAAVIAAFRRAYRAGAFMTPYTGPISKNPNSPSGNF
jgi:hypothetical protein